jgi:hypothetical protein
MRDDMVRQQREIEALRQALQEQQAVQQPVQKSETPST